MTCKGWLEITMENSLVKSKWTLNTNSASCLNKKNASQFLCILQYIFKLENVSMRIKDQEVSVFHGHLYNKNIYITQDSFEKKQL
jgi:hypothetical protein